jgi:hypothetical protein
MKHIHELTDIDTDQRTGTCPTCGKVKIRTKGFTKIGNRRWICSIKYMEALKKKRLNPKRKRIYIKLYKEQDGKCAICGCKQEENKKRFCIDHCHSSHHIRGLLCNRCNTGIGMFLDNPEFLLSAIKYLKRDA